MIEKKCSRCGQTKSIDDFHIDKSHKDGHKNICKKCLEKKKIHKNITPRLDRNIKQCINYCLKKDGPFRWGHILGFTAEDLKKHIGSLFDDDMNWENYGDYWVVSFFIPKRVYQIDNIRSPDFRSFWSLKNIRPVKKTEVYKQKVEIDMKLVDKYGLYDILPIGNYLPLVKKE